MISFQTNIDSLIAQQNLNINSQFQSQTIQQLTSGYRINSSGDDAAGLAVANQDRDQIAQITQGVANGNDGTALLQTMDGGMSNISQILDRLQTLAAQSASSSFTGSRADLNAEFQTDIGELNRQAQAIGLNTGGTYAQTMDVYLGGGGGANAAAISQNGQVSVDLSKSTVDAHSLGLAGLGMQVVAGTTDISSTATNSVYNIVNNSSNTVATPGQTVFYLSGPGFTDNNKIALHVNVSQVSDTTTLVSAINKAISSAITNSGNTLPASSVQALQAANISASINTDASGGQELSFSSSTSAFQVQAGDQMANALMGNISTATDATAGEGAAIAQTVTTANMNSTATTFGANTNLTLQISGGGLASPVSFSYLSGAGNSINSESATTFATNLVADAVNTSTYPGQATALAAAGISVTQNDSNQLVFTSATGESFNVQVTGDTQNLLGLGALDSSSAAPSAAFYSTIQGSNYQASGAAVGNGLATLGFSINGGSTDGGLPASQTTESAATLTGADTNTVVTSGKASINTYQFTSANPLLLNVNGTAVSVDFSKDANQGTSGTPTESLQNVANYINYKVNQAMGWGSDVKVATVTNPTAATGFITLTDPIANASSSLTASGTPATALGINGTAAGTDPVGSTVTVNLAGGDATQATTAVTASATAMSSGIDTSHGTSVAFTVDGKAVTANFANDTTLVNGIAANLGTAAVLTGSAIGAGPSSSVNLSSLQSQAAKVTGNALGAGAGSIDTNSLIATTASYTGTGGLADDGSGTPLSLSGDLTINGTSIDVSADTTLGQVASTITGSAAGVTATETTVNGLHTLLLTSKTAGAAGNIAVTNDAGDVAQSVGLFQAGTTTGAITTTTNGKDAASLAVTLATGGAGTVTWNSGNASDTETGADVVGYINSQLQSQFHSSATYATYDDTTGTISIAGTVTGSGEGSGLTLTNNLASQTLGLTTVGETPATVVGTDAQKVSINVDGAGAQQISFDTFGTESGGVYNGQGTMTQLASYLQTALGGSAAATVTVGDGTHGTTAGTLIITGVKTGGETSTGGTSPGSVVVANGTASQALGLTSGTGSNTVYGNNESVQNIVSFLNATAQQALGTDTNAQVFSLNGNVITMNSATKGAQSSVAVAAQAFGVTGTAGTAGNILSQLGFATAATTMSTGQNASLTSLASTLSQAFKDNTELNEAGLQAGVNGSALQIASSTGNNSNFRLEEYDTVNGSNQTSLGFTTDAGSTTTGPLNAALNNSVPASGTAASTAVLLDAGGTSTIGMGTTASPYLSFAPMQFGTDAQALTVTANDDTGTAQNLTITLRNDSGTESGSTSGSTIDSAVAYINKQLQASKNPTLESIMAVKENVGGTEQINFLSSLSSFSVNVGSSLNGNGLNGGTAQTFASESNGTANNSAVDTLAGAQAAVTAVTAAVGLLGTAQAAVGKGENQLNYAINLAQSQITNISAAESQIRDANVAMEAANLTKAQVLQQSTVAAMAQANQEPQAVLSLLKQ